MDFTLTDEQKAIADLAAQIFGDRSTPERVKAIEATPERIDRDLWAELAKAGLLGVVLPERLGGSGGGFVEACLLLEQQGRRVAMVPLLPTLVSGALSILRHGTSEQVSAHLAGVADGSTLLTAALSEPGGDPRVPVTRATRDGRRWRLDGLKIAVPIAEAARTILVPARTADGEIGVFLVEPRAAGVRLTRQETMNWESEAQMELDGALVEAGGVLGSLKDGAAVLGWIVDRTTVALCAIASGVCQEAIRLTAEYASNRKQFDKPIAMFQAVGQRMADAYIDNEAVNLTMWAAATRLADEMPSPQEVATAKYWASDGGSRIGHTALHIHGGISIDVDYPVHRLFLWLKQLEFTLGAATPQLARLGALIAAEG